jgi:hypothetical protein
MALTRKNFAKWFLGMFAVLLIVGLYDLITRESEAVLTTTPTAVDEWAEVGQNSVREGATTTISDSYQTILYIDVAITSAPAHTGTKIWVQVSANTSGDEDWYTFVEFIGPAGTVDLENLGGAEAAGQTQLEVADTTGLYDEDETRWIFIEDTGTVADSEMCVLVEHDTNVSVTVLDGLTNAKDAADVLTDIARNYVINVPFGYVRVRVIYDNTYDADGATVHTKCRISEVTAL